MTNIDPVAPTHAAVDRSHAALTWDYACRRTGLVGLTEEARQAEWSVGDLPWETPVDQERVASAVAAALGRWIGADATGSPPLAAWGDREWTELGAQISSWTMSQVVHVEQGALVCAGKLVEAMPWIEGKYFAARQAVDEARHAETFATYLDTKMVERYPINANLCQLLDDVIADARWDVSYLGMQIIIESIALGTLGVLSLLISEPLLATLVRLVMADEARHHEFGVLSLAEVYAGLSGPELRERQEFALEMLLAIRDRFLAQEVWERLDVRPADAALLMSRAPGLQQHRYRTVATVVPTLARLGLLDAGNGWLRERLASDGVLGFVSGNTPGGVRDEWLHTG